MSSTEPIDRRGLRVLPYEECLLLLRHAPPAAWGSSMPASRRCCQCSSAWTTTRRCSERRGAPSSTPRPPATWWPWRRTPWTELPHEPGASWSRVPPRSSTTTTRSPLRGSSVSSAGSARRRDGSGPSHAQDRHRARAEGRRVPGTITVQLSSHCSCALRVGPAHGRDMPITARGLIAAPELDSCCGTCARRGQQPRRPGPAEPAPLPSGPARGRTVHDRRHWCDRNHRRGASAAGCLWSVATARASSLGTWVSRNSSSAPMSTSRGQV